jgi:hypothetical protein
VIRLFRGPWSEPRVDWQLAELDELLAMSAQEAPFMLFDHRRLQLAARYLDDGAYERRLVRLDTRLWQDYELLTGAERGAFYRRRRDSGETEGSGLQWRASSGATVEEDDGRTFRVLAARETETFYLFTGVAGGDRTPPGRDPRATLRGDSVYALRFHLEHPDSLPVIGYLYQFGPPTGVVRQGLLLRSSWNTVHFEPVPGAVSFGVSLFFRAEGREAAARVSIRDTELRAWPAVGACGAAFASAE